jgi:flavin reductase (DIM6/NTAB) family NADH-FMN oxidoreductase RutF
MESKEFGVNFLAFDQAELIVSVGSNSGQLMDKFREFDIARDESVKTAVPILKSAYAAYECRLVDDREYGDHWLLVGEIVATHILEEVFTSDEVIDLGKASPVLYLGRDFYTTASEDMVISLDREVFGKR